MTGSSDPNRLNLWAARASTSVAILLILVKLWALWRTGALSIAASLTDSALDLIMSLGAMVAVIYAARPADEDHAFGHTAVEDLVAFVQALFLLVVSMGLAWGGIDRLIQNVPPGIASEGDGILAMVITLVLTVALVLFQGWVARRTGNKVIAADRLHYMADLLPALGAIAALYASRQWGLWQVDAVVALIAAGVLIKGSWSIGKGAWDALMDRQADDATIARIAQIATDWPGVEGWHDLKTRTAGSRLFVSIHVELDGSQSLRDAHAIGAGLRRALLQAFPHADVIIHKDVVHET